MKRRMLRVLFVPTLLLMVFQTHLLGQGVSEVLARHYYIDIQLFSVIPDEGIDSYRGYGRGGVGGPNATLGHYANDERQFALTVETSMRSQEFVATVRVEPKKTDKQTKTMEREFVLSDLEPQTIEIARNDDGRVYRLHLFPRIKELPKPRTFDVDELRLDYWSFPGCPVILNDQDYVGRMAMSSGQLAHIDLSGLAKIEFSLLPFRNAKPWGSLKDGVVNITHESGTSLQISDVTNGVHGDVLTGGPYQVFVRWSEPSMSEAEYRKELEETIAHVKKQIASGDLPAGKNWLERLQRAQNSDRVMMMSNGLGPIPSGDRIESE